MKIKSINDLTLAECQEYLDTNPNGEFAREVAQRMEYLRQLKDRKLQQDRARWINEFNTEFNRYYATQRYEDAFAMCLKYINNIDNKTVVLEKAKLVIPKLKNRILLPSSVTILYDWLIDQLVLNGYDKIKYDGNSLKWHECQVLLKMHTKKPEIISKCRIDISMREMGSLILIATYVLSCFIGVFYLNDYLMLENSFFVSIILLNIIGIMILLLYLPLRLRTCMKMHKESRLLLRRIANIVIDNLAK